MMDGSKTAALDDIDLDSITPTLAVTNVEYLHAVHELENNTEYDFSTISTGSPQTFDFETILNEQPLLSNDDANSSNVNDHW